MNNPTMSPVTPSPSTPAPEPLPEKGEKARELDAAAQQWNRFIDQHRDWADEFSAL